MIVSKTVEKALFKLSQRRIHRTLLVDGLHCSRFTNGIWVNGIMRVDEGRALRWEYFNLYAYDIWRNDNNESSSYI